MALYLADTNILVMYSRKIEPATSLLQQLIRNGDDIGITDIVVAEFMSGVPIADRTAWEQFLETFEFWETDFAAAVRAGQYRYDFARRGIQIQTPDALLAAVAFEHGATLITNNSRHFPMPGLKLLVP